jgi:hypothetical protein
MVKLKHFARKLLKDIRALPEDGMKLKVVGARLKKLTPEDIARVMDILYRSGPDIPGARMFQSLLVDPDELRGIIGKKKFRLTYRAALELGLEKVSRLFTDLPPHREGPFGYDKEEEARMVFLTLGERRAMAKGSVKDILDRLLSDPDTVVIGNLLNNPRITETEVLKIASKRPNSPAILKHLSTHRKWSKRYSVIKAVVRNPYTPTRISMALMEFLLTQDLEKVSTDKTLHTQVIMGAKELLGERKGGEGGEGSEGDE